MQKKIQYKIAFTDGVALQKYADSGDHVEISFNSDNGDLFYGIYSKNLNSALYYHYGTYFDLRFDSPDNNYSGYYFTDYFAEGITITYDNGRASKTNYLKCTNAEDALEKVLKVK